MNNILQFPKPQSTISNFKYLYKLYYIEENDTLWSSMQDAKTKEWGEWMKISDRFLSGEK